MKNWQKASLTLSILAGSLSQAAWVKVDDFESQTTSVFDNTSWHRYGGAQDADFALVTDPTDSMNTVFQMSNTASGTVRMNNSSISLAAGNTGSMFLRFNLNQTNGADFNFGLTEVWPSWWDWKTRNTLNGSNLNDSESSNSAPLDAGNWYSLWLVIDNSTDTYSGYLQSDGDPNYTAQTKVFDNLAFQASGTEALEYLYLFNSNKDGAVITMDDIYFDDAGTNLINPTATGVPEPSSALLLLFGSGLLIRRRR